MNALQNVILCEYENEICCLLWLSSVSMIRSNETVVFSTSEYKQDKYSNKKRKESDEKRKNLLKKQQQQNHEVEKRLGCKLQREWKMQRKTFELDFYENPKTTRSVDTIEVEIFYKLCLLNI